MESEKVKEILGRLHCKLLGDRRNEINHEEINCVGEVITLINELESENAYQKEHSEMWFRKNEEKKKRIAELEKENNEQYKRIMELEQDLVHADEKVFYRECNVTLRENEIKQQAIKQFAERLKAKRCMWETDRQVIDETLKEFINKGDEER